MLNEQTVQPKKEKFKSEKAIASFKESMGLGIGSIRAKMLSRVQ